jgi:uncharacterized protein (TIGR00730 family)
MKRVCVFCGSNSGARLQYQESAVSLGQALASNGLGLVYGGSSIGLMRAVADSVLDAGGEVIGIIPQALVGREQAYPRVRDLRVVNSMHERKAQMAALSDAFVALPGGLGTLDEIFEMLSWAQLGIHDKPCGFLDVDGYYRPLLQFLDHATAEQFIRPHHRAMILFANDPVDLLAQLRSYQPPGGNKWIATADATAI